MYISYRLSAYTFRQAKQIRLDQSIDHTQEIVCLRSIRYSFHIYSSIVQFLFRWDAGNFFVIRHTILRYGHSVRKENTERLSTGDKERRSTKSGTGNMETG